LARSAASSPAFYSGVKKRRSGPTLSKPELLVRQAFRQSQGPESIEGLTIPSEVERQAGESKGWLRSFGRRMDRMFQTQLHTKGKEILLLMICLLIGFALRFYSFDQKSLWMDEIYTVQDSRDDFSGHLEFYKEKPTNMHPPLFYILTHLFYPFNKAERDIRIFPLVFGTLSIPMIYLLSRMFSSAIALPCAFALAFMTYHIALSQEGRSYTLIMFLGMGSLYFLLNFLRTSKKAFLILVAVLFAILFHTSYSSIPFIVFSQMLWFYEPDGQEKKPHLSSFLFLISLVALLIAPWTIFILSHYKGQPLNVPWHTEDPGSFISITYGVLHDWVPHWPLMVVSVLLIILLPIFGRNRRNALVLLANFLFPVGGLYLFCKILSITHFVSSRYFINFLPLFLITLFLSFATIEARLHKLRRVMRLRLLFLILFIASNLVILPLYYRSEKQDNRGLVNYLKVNLRDGDKIFIQESAFLPGLLHYFGLKPESRYYKVYFPKGTEESAEFLRSFSYQDKTIIIYHAKTCCAQYVGDGSRLWIIVGKLEAQKLKENSPAVLMGYFDGSFLNLKQFPSDASLFLFLWDPSSPNQKGIDLPLGNDEG
jgi:hypothetical protein